MRVQKLLGALVTVLVSSGHAEAAPAWFYDGKCHDSRVKIGTLSDDLTVKKGDPITCTKANLMLLRNGNVMVSFVTGTGPMSFGGPGVDTKTNPKLLIVPIERIYPVRDFGNDPAEILKESGSGEGVLHDSEGFCFFEPKDPSKLKSLTCVAKHEEGDLKRVFTVNMTVTKARASDLPGF